MTATTEDHFPFHPAFTVGDLTLVAADNVSPHGSLRPQSMFRVSKAGFTAMSPNMATVDKQPSGILMHESAALLAHFLVFTKKGETPDLAALDLDMLVQIYDACAKNGMKDQRALLEDHIITWAPSTGSIQQVSAVIAAADKHQSQTMLDAAMKCLVSVTSSEPELIKLRNREESLWSRYDYLRTAYHDVYADLHREHRDGQAYLRDRMSLVINDHRDV